MSKEQQEKIVNDIIEYANREILRSKKRHLMILLAVLTGVALLAAVFLLVATLVYGPVMWLSLGIAAMIMAMLNVVWTLRNREAKWFRFLSLTFTAFTVYSFYAQAARWVLAEDWSALMDVLPATSKMLWFLTVASVAINSISLFRKREY